MKSHPRWRARIIALAVAILVVLTLTTTTIAGAASRPLPKQNATAHVTEGHVSPLTCTISASPASQTVGVNQTAKVLVSIDCPGGYTFVKITWGDGTVSNYPGGCTSPCNLLAEHSYAIPGDYHAKICLEPVNVCTTVEIRVV